MGQPKRHAHYRRIPIPESGTGVLPGVTTMTATHPDQKAQILLAPTITKLPEAALGAVIVSGSHGGLYPGYCAANGSVRAAIFHDAGVGKDESGIASLLYL